MYQSLSSRRAWIEINFALNVLKLNQGRSPHGERGLKSLDWHKKLKKIKSLSSRRAWIEILYFEGISICYDVALLTESVD